MLQLYSKQEISQQNTLLQLAAEVRANGSNIMSWSVWKLFDHSLYQAGMDSELQTTFNSQNAQLEWDWLLKVCEIFSKFPTLFQDSFTSCQDLCVNETLILFKGK